MKSKKLSLKKETIAKIGVRSGIRAGADGGVPTPKSQGCPPPIVPINCKYSALPA